MQFYGPGNNNQRWFGRIEDVMRFAEFGFNVVNAWFGRKNVCVADVHDNEEELPE
jgi:hypothetical protein